MEIVGNSHTAAAWVQAVPQQARMQAAVVAGPASTGSGVRPRLRRRRSRRQWDWRTGDNIVMARGVCNILPVFINIRRQLFIIRIRIYSFITSTVSLV